MEAMSIIGFVFGLSALYYVTAAKRDISQLQKDVENLKVELEQANK